jgi:hypothetical protein
MSPKGMIAIGLAWCAAVLLWLRFSPRQWGHSWDAKGTAKQAVLIAGIYVAGLLYQVFVIGWLIPLGWGIFRLIRHR